MGENHWEVKLNNYSLSSVEDDSGNTSDKIKVTLSVEDKLVDMKGSGGGPIEAFVSAVNQHFNVQIAVSDYYQHSVTSGADAKAAAFIELTSKTKNESFSFYPLGLRGDEGIPISNWSVNWSGIEKWWFMDKCFKSISISHGFNGERSMSSKDENNDGIITDDELQNEQYTFNYRILKENPKLSFNNKDNN